MCACPCEIAMSPPDHLATAERVDRAKICRSLVPAKRLLSNKQVSSSLVTKREPHH